MRRIHRCWKTVAHRQRFVDERMSGSTWIAAEKASRTNMPLEYDFHRTVDELADPGEVLDHRKPGCGLLTGHPQHDHVPLHVLAAAEFGVKPAPSSSSGDTRYLTVTRPSSKA